VNFEPELDSDERDRLRNWVDGEVPDGGVPDDFAERVAARMQPVVSPRVRVRTEPPSWTAWWIGMAAAAAAILLALSLFAGGRTATGGAAHDDLEALRLAANALLSRQCTPCHDGAAPASEPDALAVFDLADSQWYADMSDDHLAFALERVGAGSDATELAGFRRYVSAELAHRGAGLTPGQ